MRKDESTSRKTAFLLSGCGCQELEELLLQSPPKKHPRSCANITSDDAAWVLNVDFVIPILQLGLVVHTCPDKNIVRTFRSVQRGAPSLWDDSKCGRGEGAICSGRGL